MNSSPKKTISKREKIENNENGKVDKMLLQKNFIIFIYILKSENYDEC